MVLIAAPPPLVERDALTPEWFTQALSHAGVIGDRTVASVAFEPVGTGQVADTLVVSLSYAQAGEAASEAPTTVVAKVSAADAESRAAGVAQRLYEREVRFYQELVPRLGMRVPRHYYSDIDTSTGRFVLLLENMAPTATVDQISGFVVDHARRALLQAAALHAPLWADPSLQGIEWLQHSRNTGALLAQITPGLTDSFIDRYHGDLEADTVGLLQELNAKAPKFWTQPYGPQTVVHGDFRPDNMLFDARGGSVPVAVVDWQTVDCGNGLLDVAFLLGTALPADVRRSHERGLVEEYYDALLAGGVADYSWPQCWNDYRRFASYTVFFLTPAAMLVERTDRGDQMFLTMIRRAAAHIADLDTLSLLD